MECLPVLQQLFEVFQEAISTSVPLCHPEHNQQSIIKNIRKIHDKDGRVEVKRDRVNCVTEKGGFYHQLQYFLVLEAEIYSVSPWLD